MNTPPRRFGRSPGGPVHRASTRLRRAVVGVAVASRPSSEPLGIAALVALVASSGLALALLVAPIAGSGLGPGRIDPPAAALISSLLALAALVAAMSASNTPAAAGRVARARLVPQDPPW